MTQFEIGAYHSNLYADGTDDRDLVTNVVVETRGTPRERLVAELQQAMEYGLPFDRAALPDAVMPGGRPKMRERFVTYNSFICVRDEAADVLTAHDLGEGFLWPMAHVTGLSRRETLPGRWFGLHVGAYKQAYLPDVSRLNTRHPGTKPRYAIELSRVEENGTRVRLGDPNAICVGPIAVEGVDLWRDPLLGRHDIFVSVRLADALREAGVARDFDLTACTLVLPSI